MRAGELCAQDIRRAGRGLTVRYGRHSQLLRTMLQAIGLALAGRAGARLALRLASPVSLALPSDLLHSYLASLRFPVVVLRIADRRHIGPRHTVQGASRTV